ncbi:MAG TPA: hypothetical protein VNV39_11485 [Stellaceae bacterium]|jgi:hypothetical protein|nr:hypothetical protein [Stellaceae bacterium]
MPARLATADARIATDDGSGTGVTGSAGQGVAAACQMATAPPATTQPNVPRLAKTASL